MCIEERTIGHNKTTNPLFFYGVRLFPIPLHWVKIGFDSGYKYFVLARSGFFESCQLREIYLVTLVLARTVNGPKFQILKSSFQKI
jgi:hypothetical protein